ncbi:hypothetical protein ZONE111904_04335 [Zobellia nedashkovskayae]
MGYIRIKQIANEKMSLAFFKTSKSFRYTKNALSLIGFQYG